MTIKPHLSPSQITMYCRCGEQYRRRYIEKHIIPPAIALIKGSAVHIGAETNARQKIQSRKDLPASQIQEAAAAAFDTKVKQEGVLFSVEEEGRGKGMVLGEAKDSAVGLAGLYCVEVAPKYQPVYVEEKQTIPLPKSSHDLQGIMDLVDDKATLVDLKTGAKAKGQAEVDGDLQLTFYAVLYRFKTGLPPKKLVIEQLIDSGSRQRVNTIETSRTGRDHEALISRINAVITGINAGIFIPAVSGSWWCSARFCGYARTCPYYAMREE